MTIIRERKLVMVWKRIMVRGENDGQGDRCRSVGEKKRRALKGWEGRGGGGYRGRKKQAQ